MDNVLIIGGTNFIGRNLIEAFLKTEQYNLTLFNRGQTNPKLFPEIKRITGDRNTHDIKKLESTNWDYIIDLSCYYPDSLDHILSTVNKSLRKYIFISTCSVYDTDKDQTVLRSEDAMTRSCTTIESKDTSTATYGKRKARCEQLLRNSGLPYSILRPALVFGRYDNTDRLYYWLYQIKKENQILIPNEGLQPFSATYIHDLVNAIILELNEKNKNHTYTITSYPTLSIRQILDCCIKLLNKKPKLYFAPEDSLFSHGIEEWKDLPLWLNCDHFTFNNTKIKSTHGIHFTDLDKALEQTIAYYNEIEWPEPNFGISNKRKMKIIDTLKLTF